MQQPLPVTEVQIIAKSKDQCLQRITQSNSAIDAAVYDICLPAGIVQDVSAWQALELSIEDANEWTVEITQSPLPHRQSTPAIAINGPPEALAGTYLMPIVRR